MTQQKSIGGGLPQPIKQGTQRVTDSPWFERFARFGYAAKGVVYLVAGALSLRAAFGLGGAPTDSRGALQQIVTEPFGKVMLILIGVGLIGYVLLRLVQAVMDPEHKGRDAQGIATRTGYLISAAVYAGLAWTAVQLAYGTGGTGTSGTQSQSWVSQLFALPFGHWLIGIVGLAVIGGGLYQLYQAYRTNFSERFNWSQMNTQERLWAVRLGRLGLAARGVVQGVVGIFLVQAALLVDPRKVQGADGALQMLAQPPFGLWAVAVVAAGLAAYGIYMLAAARYARIVTSSHGVA
jgi:hypothetical protein